MDNAVSSASGAWRRMSPGLSSTSTWPPAGSQLRSVRQSKNASQFRPNQSGNSRASATRAEEGVPVVAAGQVRLRAAVAPLPGRGADQVRVRRGEWEAAYRFTAGVELGQQVALHDPPSKLRNER